MQLAYHEFADLSSVSNVFTAVAKSPDAMRRAMPSSDFATALGHLLSTRAKNEGEGHATLALVILWEVEQIFL
jgi:hypothetical protein